MNAVEALEYEWANWAGYEPENVVACSSGTSALVLALEGLRLSSYSSAIMSDFNMIACPRAAVMANLQPFFLDCDDRLLLDPLPFASAREREIESHPGRELDTVILATHVYGRRCDMTALALYSNRHHVYLVEDLAEAHGIRPHSESNAACWSLYRNKIVTSGEEGGIVAFKSEHHANLARSLRSLGFTRKHDFMHTPRGLSCRLAESLAQKARSSLHSLETNLSLRRAIEEVYDRHCPEDWKMPHRDVPWVYDLRIPGLVQEVQDRVVWSLKASGIEGRHGFKPCSLQDEFFQASEPMRPRALRASIEVIYLPIVPGETNERVVKRSLEIIKDILHES